MDSVRIRGVANQPGLKRNRVSGEMRRTLMGMSQQPAAEIPADENEAREVENGRRMIAACDNDHVAAERAALARASRPARRVVMLPID